MLAEHCKLFVTFGGAPHKNAQINAGGAMVHRLKDGLYGMRAKGVRFVNITPTAEDLDTGGDIEWLAIRPNTDAAMILALCHVLLTEKLYDREFLDRCTVGFDKFAPSLADKTPEWAEKITGIPAARIRALAREMAATRTTVNINWSLQRSHHGEQPFWALVTLACMLGQIGLPGGGFGASYGPTNVMGSNIARCSRARRCRRAPTRSPTSSRSRASPTCCSIRAARFRTTGRRSPIPTSSWSTGRAAIRSITTRTSTACGPRGASPRRSSSTSSSGRRPRRWPTSCCPRPPASSATISATPAASPS